MIQNISSKLQHLRDVYHIRVSGPCSKVNASLRAEYFPLLHITCGLLQDCTSGRFINVAAEQTEGMTDFRFTQRSH